MGKSERELATEALRQLETDDEIEILEVVGVDDADPGEDEDETDEVILLEADEPEDACASVSPGPEPPAAPAADPEGADPAVDLQVVAERERFLRLQNDFETYKRRVERERDVHRDQATSGLILRMLPVLDNFERALSAGPQPDNEAAMRDGVVLIFRQILDELRKEGLEAMEVIGEPFDPAVHAAVDTESDSCFPPNTVVEEVLRGYRLAGRLLRPAQVRVSVESEDTDAETN